MHHPFIALALVGSSVLAVTACGSDDTTDGLAGQDEWCTVVGEVDDVLASTDPSEDFAAAKSASERVNGDVRELIASIDVVDESVRDDVGETLQFVADFTAAIADASDQGAAEAALVPIFESLPEGGDETSRAWILETCGVDISD